MTKQEELFFQQMGMGIFSIDESGRIWRHKRFVATGRIKKKIILIDIPKRRAETARSHNHLRVQMCEEAKKIVVYAHRVVWIHFNKKEIPSGMDINHLNGKPQDNSPANLETATRQENTIHAGRVLHVMGKKMQNGEANTSAKLTVEKVYQIRDLCEAELWSQKMIAGWFGVSQSTISDIHQRRTWTHLVSIGSFWAEKQAQAQGR